MTIPPVSYLFSFLSCIGNSVGLLLLWNAWNDRPVAIKQQVTVGAVHTLLLYAYHLLYIVSSEALGYSTFLRWITALSDDMFRMFSVHAFYPFELTLFLLVIFWGFRHVPFSRRCWTAVLSYCCYQVLYLLLGLIMPQKSLPVQLPLLVLAALFLLVSKRFLLASWYTRHTLTIHILCGAMLLPHILWLLLALTATLLDLGDLDGFGAAYAVPYIILLILLLGSLIVSRVSHREKQKAMLKNTADHMSDLNRLIDESRQNIHDFNKHIRYLRNVVNIYCEQGDTAALQSEINAYCEELLERSEKDEILLHLDDPTLRALLYGRRAEAKAADIDFILDASTLLPHFPVKNFQMVEIFENLMENAFDCVGALDGNRFIRIILDCEQITDNTFRHVLCIQNPYDTLDIDSLSSGKRFTSKSGDHQGIGLSKVGRLVADTGGKLIFGYEDHIFSAKIVYEENAF